MALTLTEINELSNRLRRAAPHLLDEINELSAAAIAGRRVQFVEVTHADGACRVMPAEEYQRQTALDLRHSRIRVLSEAEAKRFGGRA